MKKESNIGMTQSGRIRVPLLGLVVLIAALSTCTASPTGNPDSLRLANCEDLLGFAEHLRSERDYFRAVTEYKRALYTCPQEGLRKRAFTGVAYAYFSAERYFDVVDWCGSPEDQGLRGIDMSLLIGHSLFRIGDYLDALTPLERVYVTVSGTLEYSQAKYLTGLSLVRLWRLPEAIPEFRAVAESSPYWERATRYSGLLDETDSHPTRSPRLAAALGVIPGLGYAYTGHYRTAVASLALNGLLIWATADAFNDGNNAAGTFFSIFAVGFYFGNILGSWQSAIRFNEYHAEEFQSIFPE